MTYSNGEIILCPGCPAGGEYCGSLEDKDSLVFDISPEGTTVAFAFQDGFDLESKWIEYPEDLAIDEKIVEKILPWVHQLLVKQRIGNCHNMRIDADTQAVYCPALVPNAIKRAVDVSLERLHNPDREIPAVFADED